MRNLLVTLALAAVAAACATSKPVRKEIVWPDPPEKARIRFVTAFADTETLDDSGWNKFKRSILGGVDQVRLQQPMGLALNDDGQRVYIADFMAATIFVADMKEKTFKAFASGQGFAQPFGIAVDSSENVYVADSGARSLAAYDKRGERLWSTTKDLDRPTGLCLDRAHALLYAVDSGTQASQNHRVFAYDLQGHRLHEVGNGKGSEDTQFHFPIYCAVDRDGKLFVGDSMNFRIQVFDHTGQYQGKYGQNGDSPGDFARIKGIDFDGFGNLYVADGQHSAVQIFNRDWDVLMHFGGYAPYVEYFDIPSCMAIDRKTNRIYVCNEHNPRINVYELINTAATDSARPKDDAQPAPADAQPASPRR